MAHVLIHLSQICPSTQRFASARVRPLLGVPLSKGQTADSASHNKYSLHPVCEPDGGAGQLSFLKTNHNTGYSSRYPSRRQIAPPGGECVPPRPLSKQGRSEKFVPRPVLPKYRHKVESQRKTWHSDANTLSTGNRSHANSCWDLPIPPRTLAHKWNHSQRC